MSNKEFTKESLSITFHKMPVYSDLSRYIDEESILVLLNRLPLEEYQHLRSVTFETCRGGYTYGYVHTKRIHGITNYL